MSWHALGVGMINKCVVFRQCLCFLDVLERGALSSCSVRSCNFESFCSPRCLVHFLLKLVWHSSCPCGGVFFFFLSFADMSSGLRTKVFEGYIMPLVQRWIADNPLRWHDQTLDFHRWWQIIMGYSLADASTRETEPDYRIVLEAGVRRVLKHSGFRSRVFDFTTYLWTSQDHISTKSCIENVA